MLKCTKLWYLSKIHILQKINIGYLWVWYDLPDCFKVRAFFWKIICFKMYQMWKQKQLLVRGGGVLRKIGRVTLMPVSWMVWLWLSTLLSRRQCAARWRVVLLSDLSLREQYINIPCGAYFSFPGQSHHTCRVLSHSQTVHDTGIIRAQVCIMHLVHYYISNCSSAVGLFIFLFSS